MTIPEDVRSAIASLDRSYARSWSRTRERPGYVAGNVYTGDLGVVLDFVRGLISETPSEGKENG